jgi:Mn2+/Fe2+ NRAMP family transporter
MTTARLTRRLKKIGPALVLAAVVLGPGSITLSTIAGSLYGYRLLWVLLCATVFMITYTLMAARIGLVSRKTLFELVRRKHGQRTAKAAAIFGFLSILAFQAGNCAAVGFAGSAFFGFDSRVWSTVFLLLAVAFFLQPRLYLKLELFVKLAIGLMVAAFLGTLLVVGVDFDGMILGVVPSFPDSASVFLSLGMAATTFSVAAAAYQNYLMREKRWGIDDLANEGLDCLFGIAILGCISMVILLTSAGVLHESGQPVFSAQTMARQLEPLAGPLAYYLFTSGFFFAAFSSLIVNPLIGATLLVDGFGHESSMDSRRVRGWAIVVMAIGLLVVLIFQGSPVELLRIAQALAVVAFPLLGFLIWSLANDASIMGRHGNSWVMNVLAALGYATIVGIALNYVRQITGFF